MSPREVTYGNWQHFQIDFPGGWVLWPSLNLPGALYGFRWRPRIRARKGVVPGRGMIGDLLASFCERGREGGTKCLELWTYPDQTLNLVVTRVSCFDETEFCFPCAPHHFLGVLDGSRPFLSENAEAGIVLRRENDVVVATVRPSEADQNWQQRVPVESLESALASGGFLY